MGLLGCPLNLTYDKLTTLVVAGTGKTMLVKAVAHHITASFIRIVGPEFVQKYLGEQTPSLSSSSTKSTKSRQTD
jgi:AAA+ superfamily predicted ATPase